MPDKGWPLSDFGGAFLHLSAGNGKMPLNPYPKIPPNIVFFVLYEFRVVCVLYFLCYMKLSLFNFFFSNFWNWKQNGSCLMRLYSWVGSILQSNRKSMIPAGLSCRISDESFTTNRPYLKFYFLLKKLKVLPVLYKRVRVVCML